MRVDYHLAQAAGGGECRIPKNGQLLAEKGGSTAPFRGPPAICAALPAACGHGDQGTFPLLPPMQLTPWKTPGGDTQSPPSPGCSTLVPAPLLVRGSAWEAPSLPPRPWAGALAGAVALLGVGPGRLLVCQPPSPHPDTWGKAVHLLGSPGSCDRVGTAPSWHSLSSLPLISNLLFYSPPTKLGLYPTWKGPLLTVPVAQRPPKPGLSVSSLEWLLIAPSYLKFLL